MKIKLIQLILNPRLIQSLPIKKIKKKFRKENSKCTKLSIYADDVYVTMDPTDFLNGKKMSLV